VRELLFLQEAIEGLASLDARARFERAGAIVEARMDDAAVTPALMDGEARFGLQDDERAGSRGLQKSARGGEPDESAADESDVIRPRAHTFRSR
jgi:hypothetical protein